ncbi:MAG TPA: hypothetical protein VIM70_05630 [Clostridium sp.]|uniref:hypothetical protein n=1 Tax=Clostridium sp. TaxID=1506 RepID=UPI002F952967
MNCRKLSINARLYSFCDARAVFIGEGTVGALGVVILIRLWFIAKKQGRERLISN